MDQLSGRLICHRQQLQANSVPSASDTVLFNNGGTYTVTVPDGTNVGRALIKNDDVTFNLGGGTMTLNDSTVSPNLLIGPFSGDSAALTVSNGTLNADSVTIAQTPGGNGILNLQGTAALVVTGDLRLGRGQGMLNASVGRASRWVDNWLLRVTATL